jgi:hypothetical protein
MRRKREPALSMQPESSTRLPGGMVTSLSAPDTGTKFALLVHVAAESQRLSDASQWGQPAVVHEGSVPHVAALDDDAGTGYDAGSTQPAMPAVLPVQRQGLLDGEGGDGEGGFGGVGGEGEGGTGDGGTGGGEGDGGLGEGGLGEGGAGGLGEGGTGEGGDGGFGEGGTGEGGAGGLGEGGLGDGGDGGEGGFGDGGLGEGGEGGVGGRGDGGLGDGGFGEGGRGDGGLGMSEQAPQVLRQKLLSVTHVSLQEPHDLRSAHVYWSVQRRSTHGRPTPLHTPHASWQ